MFLVYRDQIFQSIVHGFIPKDGVKWSHPLSKEIDQYATIIQNGARYGCNLYYSLIGNRISAFDRNYYRWPWMTFNGPLAVITRYLTQYYCVLVASADTRWHLRSANRQLLAVPRYRLNTLTAVVPFQLPTPQSGTLSRILSGTRPSVETVSEVCFKRICSLDTIRNMHPRCSFTVCF